MAIIPLDEMPEHKDDLKNLDIGFPHLSQEQTARHSDLITDAIKYLDIEVDVFDPDDLNFLRSAQVENQKFWIWEFYDTMGEHCYVAVSENPNGGISIGYDESAGLTPEQFLLAEYHGCY